MRAAVFGGTSEGRRIAMYLSAKGIQTQVYVATEQGREVMPPMPHITVNTGRLDSDGMVRVLYNEDIVIDATHPYAAEASKNILSACARDGVRYIRLLREEQAADGMTYAEDISAAAMLLKGTEGRIFVSTGSKELEKYTVIDGYADRLTARVLPTEEARAKCRRLGLKNVIYARGPFTEEENLKAFADHDISHLVTKSSGRTGGFEEKINAAKRLKINVIVIKRPTMEKGLSFDEVKELIDRIRSGSDDIHT